MNTKDFEKLLATGTPAELRALLLDHIETKKRLEAQLGADKAEMQAERSQYLQEGLDPRKAQMEATAGTDFEWRQKARTKLRFIDSELPKLRARLHQIGEASQRVVVLRGDAPTVGAQVDELVKAGNYVQQLLSHDGAVLVLCKGVA